MMAILGDDEDDGTHWIACARVTGGEECDCYLAVRAALAPLLEQVGEPEDDLEVKLTETEKQAQDMFDASYPEEE